MHTPMFLLPYAVSKRRGTRYICFFSFYFCPLAFVTPRTQTSLVCGCTRLAWLPPTHSRRGWSRPISGGTRRKRKMLMQSLPFPQLNLLAAASGTTRSAFVCRPYMLDVIARLSKLRKWPLFLSFFLSLFFSHVLLRYLPFPKG